MREQKDNTKTEQLQERVQSFFNSMPRDQLKENLQEFVMLALSHPDIEYYKPNERNSLTCTIRELLNLCKDANVLVS